MGAIIPFPRPVDPFAEEDQSGACDVSVYKQFLGNYTVLTLRGHPNLVKQAVEAQMEIFHPAGYGTHVCGQRKCAKGQMEVTVVRLNEPLCCAC